ncbi:MAG: hypothetical protein ACUVWZ_09915 [Anaerolineae bacterium]
MILDMAQRTIAHLDDLVATLPVEDRLRFERIFHLQVTAGQTVPPETMFPWLTDLFGSVEAVRQQRIIRVTNLVTLEGTLFNELRARRPIEAPPASEELETRISRRNACAFCYPLEQTPADLLGRIRGKGVTTASNVAKYDGWHTVLIADEHHPLSFTAELVADYLDVAQQWAAAVHQIDPQACYPFFLWNCLWRSGASIIHGHAQMTVARGIHYAKVESWRQAAARYRSRHGTDYFADLIAVHRALGLALDLGTAAILPSLTPFKEKETYIIAPGLNDDLKRALYHVLQTFIGRLGVQSFNLALYQPPLGQTPEDWTGFPYLFRILDRGPLTLPTSDVGAMEFFAQSVVVTDPFRVVDALQAENLSHHEAGDR